MVHHALPNRHGIETDEWGRRPAALLRNRDARRRPVAGERFRGTAPMHRFFRRRRRSSTVPPSILPSGAIAHGTVRVRRLPRFNESTYLFSSGNFHTSPSASCGLPPPDRRNPNCRQNEAADAGSGTVPAAAAGRKSELCLPSRNQARDSSAGSATGHFRRRRRRCLGPRP